MQYENWKNNPSHCPEQQSLSPETSHRPPYLEYSYKKSDVVKILKRLNNVCQSTDDLLVPLDCLG